MKVRHHSHKVFVGMKTEDEIETAVQGYCGRSMSDKQGKCGLPLICNHGDVFIGSFQLKTAIFFKRILHPGSRTKNSACVRESLEKTRTIDVCFFLEKEGEKILTSY